MSDSQKRNGSSGEGPQSEADLEARRRALEAKLDAVKRGSEERAGKPEEGVVVGGLGRGFRYSADFMAGVLAGFLIGWGLDHLFGTSPWGLIVFIVLGFAAGVFNLVRLVERERQERERR